MEVVSYEHTIPRDVLDEIQKVHQLVFNGDLLMEKKLQKPQFFALVATLGGQVIGFKLGYEMEPGVFYSWLGGVDPDYRKQGVAQQLMASQHAYCLEKGYKKVRTYGRNSKKAMLLLNIKSGFDIVGTFVDDKGRHKIVFEKNL